MKFLIRSHWGESLAIALRLQAEGNEVQMFIGDEPAKTVGDGLVRKAVDFDRVVQWADVVVYESNIFELPKEAERVRSVRPVFGSSALAGRLENDRMFAIETARKHGLVTGDPIKSFSGPNAWSQARRFLQGADEDQGFVWKPNGEALAQTYCSDNVIEMDRMLRYFADLYVEHHEEPSFILTPLIAGVEVSTEGWWDGSKFSLFNHTIERNRLMPGDLGEKTGCSGNVVWLAPDSRLAEKLITPFENVLGNGYRGPFDVNAIIREEDNEPVFLEFTPRFGYDAIFAMLELVDDFGKLIFDCATGAIHNAASKNKPFAATYRITIPPFPEEPSKEDETKAIGVPIFGLDVNDQNGIHFTEVRLDHNDELETSGPGGFVMTVSAKGSSPAEAMQAAFKRGKPIKIPRMRWRNDLDTAIQEVYDDLMKTGWLENEKSQPLGLFGGQRRSRGRNVSISEALVSMDDGSGDGTGLDSGILGTVFGRLK